MQISTSALHVLLSFSLSRDMKFEKINRYLYCLLITENDFNSNNSGDPVRLMKTNN